MKRIEAIARIVKPDQTAAGGLQTRLQFFSLAQAGWQNLADGTTDAEGNLRLAADLDLPDDRPAPNLRLIRAAGNAILSDGGPIRYDKAKGLLLIEFGEIVDLGVDTVRPVALDRRMARTANVVGGVPAPSANAFVAMDRGFMIMQPPQKEELAARLAGETRRAGELENRLVATERTNQQLNMQVVRLGGLETDLANANKLNQQLSRDVGRVGDLETRLTQANQENTRLKAETGRIAEMQRELEETKKRNEQLSAPAPKKVSMEAMATNIGQQIGAAQRNISRQPHAFALSGVRVRVKGIVEDGATNITLPDAKDLAKAELGAGLTDVDLDFATAAPPAALAGVEVPDVRRLTESAVRQVLHSLGLRLEAVRGPAGSGGVAAGQAALQAPRAGERAERGTAVTVVFAS